MEDGVELGTMHGRTVRDRVFEVIDKCQRHTFIILTKCPRTLLERFYYPPNVWLGVSVDRVSRLKSLSYLRETRAKVKVVSFEPLLERMPLTLDLRRVNWVIIGGLTGRHKMIPEREWVRVIIQKARDLSIPVFIKHNAYYPEVVREMPV